METEKSVSFCYFRLLTCTFLVPFWFLYVYSFIHLVLFSTSLCYYTSLSVHETSPYNFIVQSSIYKTSIIRKRTSLYVFFYLQSFTKKHFKNFCKYHYNDSYPLYKCYNIITDRARETNKTHLSNNKIKGVKKL